MNSPGQPQQHHYFNKEWSDANAAIAWTEPKNPKTLKARRVKVWLKKSITNLASPSAVDFENEDRGEFRRDRPQRSQPQQRSLEHTSSRFNISTTTSRKTTTTIDQAMFSLYTYVGPKSKVSSVIQVEPETPSSYVPGYDYDWLLDGKREWKSDDATSQAYLDSLNNPWDMESYLEKFLEEWQKTIQQEMQKEQEQFQFPVNFEDAASADEKQDQQNEDTDSEEDFGDFQEAPKVMIETEMVDANDNPSQTPHATEAGKSQEEEMVEKAVKILKSCATADFDEEFGTADNSEGNLILAEMCNLENELGQLQSGNDNTDGTTNQASENDQQKDCFIPDQKTSIKAEAASGQPGEYVESVPNDSSANNASCTEDGPSVDSNTSTLCFENSTLNAPNNQQDEEQPKRAQVLPGRVPVTEAAVPSSDLIAIDYDNDDDFGDFHDPTVTPPGPVEVDEASGDQDDDFGDFQDSTVTPSEHVVADEDRGDQVNLSSTTANSSAQMRFATTLAQDPPDTIAAQESYKVVDSIRPTFAVIPPLTVDASVRVQQAKQIIRQSSSVESQQCPSPEQRQGIAPPELIEAPFHTSISELDLSEYDDVSVDGNAVIEEEEYIRVSWRLPITDLSTPVARFARRQRQKYKRAIKSKTAEELRPDSTASLFSVLEKGKDEDEDGEPLVSLSDLDLPHYYFTQADFDDTSRVLQSVPWHHIAHMWDNATEEDKGLQMVSSYSFEDQLDQRALWDEYITQELCHLDAAQNQVAKHLLRRIQPHEGVLQRANQSIHEFATNLQIAQMYILRSHASIRRAAHGTVDPPSNFLDESSGWFGAHELLKAWETKDMYGHLDSILKKIQDIFSTERYLQERICEYTFQACKPRDYYIIIQGVKQLQSNVLGNYSFSRMTALADLRVRLARNELLHKLYSRLHTLAESVAVRCCRRRSQGLSDEYKTMLEATMEVDSLIRVKCQRDELLQSSGEEGNATIQTEEHDHPPSPPELTKSWPEKILKALFFEADRALATALLDPFVHANSSLVDSSIDSEYERELTQLAYEIQQGWGDSAKLMTLTHNLVIIRFDWESSSRYFLPVYHRLCLILGDVVYAHHLLGQWHEHVIKELGCSGVPMEEGKEEKKEMTEERLNPKTSPLEEELRHTERRKLVDELRRGWTNSKSVLWQRCEDVMVKCLEEYLHFASSQNLFKGSLPLRGKDETPTQSRKQQETGGGDDRWRVDLEELHNVLILTQQFYSLKPLLFDEGGRSNNFCTRSINTSEVGAAVKDKLCDVFRKHLRIVHVEAMKSLGLSLSRESWDMIPLTQLSLFEKSVNNSNLKDQKVSLKELLAGALLDSFDRIEKSAATAKAGSAIIGSATALQRSLFDKSSTSTDTANCFLVVDEFNACGAEPTRFERSYQASEQSNERENNEVYYLISSVLAGGDEATSFTRIASKSVADVVFLWAARLLVIMEKLPPIVEDVSVVFANLCDLYYTTVFRVCAGNARSERILLGIDLPTPSVSSEDVKLPISNSKPEKSPATPPLFGFGRRSSSSSLSGRHNAQTMKVELPATLEADLCAPLVSETSKLSVTRGFIERAQKTLSSIVLLDKVDKWLLDPSGVMSSGSSQEEDHLFAKVIKNFERRLGAAWSCLGVAVVLDAACFLARIKLSQAPQALDELSTLDHYNQAALQMLPHLVRISDRVSSVRAVMARRVVTEIVQVGPGWETDQMSEHGNEYVDELTSRCSCIWAALSVSTKKLPLGLLRLTWKTLIESGYASLLEGFSRVRYCSTEGRSLMSMDLASFAAGIHPSVVMERLDYQIEYEAPPKAEPENGMRYVDTYVKAFYYPKKDIMNWIIENHEKYQMNHFLKLTAYAYRGSDGEGATAEEALQLVKKVFQDERAEHDTATVVEKAGQQTLPVKNELLER